jgi:SAM-dependent methyltransferase
MNGSRQGGSFRDPAGFLLHHEGILYREVLSGGFADYRRLMDSQLYDVLVQRELLVAHREAVPPYPVGPEHCVTLEPVLVEFISYPYEWCFSQLQDAALLTLKIMSISLDHGMILKDASAYNVQFHQGKPIFIDTLSFTPYKEGAIWPAYRQFCQHFLAPLALMCKTDVRLSGMLATHIDGIPLDLASTLLPTGTWMNFPLFLHLHMHARSQRKYAAQSDLSGIRTRNVSLRSLRGLLDSLAGCVASMGWRPAGTEWGDYYLDTNYTESSFAEKKEIVGMFVAQSKAETVWDLGANTGVFSDIAAAAGAQVVAFDIDPAAVEKLYRRNRVEVKNNILPLLQDLNSPSPDHGWALRERNSLVARGPADLCLVLALIHHLAISNNVPLAEIASFLRRIGRMIVVEFVPKDDSQVNRLLATRVDIFPDYTQQKFEEEFSRFFRIVSRKPIAASKRLLYLMESLADR